MVLPLFLGLVGQAAMTTIVHGTPIQRELATDPNRARLVRSNIALILSLQLYGKY